MLLASCTVQEDENLLFLAILKVWLPSHRIEGLDVYSPRAQLHPVERRLTHLQNSNEDSRRRRSLSCLLLNRHFLLFQLIVRQSMKVFQRLFDVVEIQEKWVVRELPLRQEDL